MEVICKFGVGRGAAATSNAAIEEQDMAASAEREKTDNMDTRIVTMQRFA
jgi:hypothetical protein